MYTKKYYIGSNDIDRFLDLKLSSFFKMMQDIATEHAEVLHIGKADTLDKDLYWVITRVELDILKMPKYLQTVTLTTYPGDDLRFIFPRYFKLEDEEGNLLIKASSTWMVLSHKTHNVVLNPFNGFKAPTEHLEGEQPLPAKCADDKVIEVEKRKVRYSDTDLNGHLNNTKYIDYVIDVHNGDFYNLHQIKHFLINYDKELLNDQVLTLSTNNSFPEVIKGEVDGKTAFTVNIDYIDR